MKRIGLVLVIGLAACGSPAAKKPATNNGGSGTQGTDPPKTKSKPTTTSQGPKGASGHSGSTTPSGPKGGTCTTGTDSTAFTGKVADLRKSAKKSGASVTLNNVVLTGIAGNGKVYYVADDTFGDYSGIEIGCDVGECKNAPKSLGERVKIVGSLQVTADCLGMRIVKTTTFSDLNGSAPVTAESETADKVGDKNANPNLRGVKVALSGQFSVTSVTPSDMLNTNWTAAADTACSSSSSKAAASKCCTVGPKYEGFEVTDGTTTVRVSTALYSDVANNKSGFSLTGWPCDGNTSAANVVHVGDTFTSLSGIFDVNMGAAAFMPTTDADAPRVAVGPPPATGTTGTTMQTGTTGPSGTSGDNSGQTGSSGTISTDPGSCCSCSGGCGAEDCTYSCTCTCPGSEAPLFCTSCTDDTQCGGNGAYCLPDGAGNWFCGSYCESNDDCDVGSECWELDGVQDNQSVIVGYNCFPSSNYCPAQ